MPLSSGTRETYGISPYDHDGNIKTQIANGTEIVAAAIKWRNIDRRMFNDTKMYPINVIDQMDAELQEAYDNFLSLLDTRSEVNK